MPHDEIMWRQGYAPKKVCISHIWYNLPMCFQEILAGVEFGWDRCCTRAMSA
jgi:hypothetical protein